MDRLAQARLVLAQLKQEHRDFHINLARISAEIQACEDMVEDLARAKAPINTLPPEILSYVLELALSPGKEDETLSLASVSHLERHHSRLTEILESD